MERLHRPPPELGQGDHGRLARIGAVAQPAGQVSAAGGAKAQYCHRGGQVIGDHADQLPQLPHRFGVPGSLDSEAEGKSVEDHPLQHASPIEGVGIGEPVVRERCQ